MERIEKQQGFLEKEKEKFIKVMDNSKADFTQEIMELEALTSGFKQYQDGANYEEIAQMAKNYKQRCDEANEMAKKINNRESLVTKDEPTDYSSIPQMIKDFKPYYDLWTWVETYRKSHHSWCNDPFDELDAQDVEDKVDNANKVMAQVLRFFRDKEVPGIVKIAEQLKADVSDF